MGAMQPYPPLGSLYAASYLQSKGYQVAFFDAMLAESERQWEKTLEKECPRFAVLFEDHFNYLSKMCLLRMRQAAFTMIAMAKEKGCRVIVCGADASDHALEYLTQGADYVLIGEGEITLGELVDHLTGRTVTGLELILGLTYLLPGDRTKMLCNPRRPDIHDLDALPFPAWDLVDIDRYASIWKNAMGISQ
jgi:anaerobic magnesium-protoporphyrin IX monomethyl ester cyclase